MSRPRVTGKVLALIFVPLLLAFGVMQLVPYRVTNPAVVQEPTWDSAQTRQLAKAACFDCHSNETHTYWFEKIAPLSYWIKGHVDGGRGALNFSECKQTGEAEKVTRRKLSATGRCRPGTTTGLASTRTRS